MRARLGGGTLGARSIQRSAVTALGALALVLAPSPARGGLGADGEPAPRREDHGALVVLDLYGTYEEMGRQEVRLLGDEARAAMATAERYSLTGEPGLALMSAEAAMGGLPSNSPDWLRAQDIALVARARLEEERRRDRQNPDRR